MCQKYTAYLCITNPGFQDAMMLFLFFTAIFLFVVPEFLHASIHPTTGFVLRSFSRALHSFPPPASVAHCKDLISKSSAKPLPAVLNGQGAITTTSYIGFIPVFTTSKRIKQEDTYMYNLFIDYINYTCKCL